jgi:hypothetical protein
MDLEQLSKEITIDTAATADIATSWCIGNQTT